MTSESRRVEYRDRPGYMTGEVIGASGDGAKLAVRWSDGVTRAELAGDVQDVNAASATVTREQAEAVRQAVMAKYPAYCMTFALVDGKPDYGTTVQAPDGELPLLMQDYRHNPASEPVPWAVVWEVGPFEWATIPLGDTAVDEEATTEVQEFAPGKVLLHKAVTAPADVRLEPVANYVLGIYPNH